MKKFLIENSLALVLFGLFAITMAGLIVSGFIYQNNELAAHGQPGTSIGEYLLSSDFYEAVSENWESEFLQMGVLVILTIWLKQKGSPDSKKLRGKDGVDTESRYSIINSSSWTNRKKAIGEALYANSLSIALFAIFILSFIVHAISGAAAANEEALLHGEEVKTTLQYVSSSQFWFESFQNWQSEFLAIGALIVLSIFLRQRKSPQSKPIGEPNSETGS